MAAPSNRVLLMLAAFLGSLAVVLGGILWLTKDIRPAASSSRAPSAGRSSSPIRMARPSRTRISAASRSGVLRLHPLSGRLPDHAVRGVRNHARLGQDADRTAALFISVDPERDTPEKLKDYLSSFDPHLRGATGDAGRRSRRWRRPIASITRKFRTTGDDYTMDHTAHRVSDGQGRPLRRTIQHQARAGSRQPRNCDVISELY